MYNQWLLFFYSPLQQIQNKPITKEWLPNGSMKIIGTHPSTWSVTLQPGTNRPYHYYMYQLQEEKQEALHKMRLAIESRKPDQFTASDKLYEEIKENESKGRSWLEKQEKKIGQIEDKLFVSKQELYKLRSQRSNKDYFQQRRTLETKIRNLTNEKRALMNDQEELLQNYSTDNPSVRQTGPVPDPPKFTEKQSKTEKEQKGGGEDAAAAEAAAAAAEAVEAAAAEAAEEISYKIKVINVIKVKEENS